MAHTTPKVRKKQITLDRKYKVIKLVNLQEPAIGSTMTIGQVDKILTDIWNETELVIIHK